MSRYYEPCGRPHVAYVYVIIFLAMFANGLTLSVAPNVQTGFFNHGDQCTAQGDNEKPSCKHAVSIVAIVKSVSMAIGAMCSFFFNPVLGRISDSVGRRPVLVCSERDRSTLLSVCTVCDVVGSHLSLRPLRPLCPLY